MTSRVLAGVEQLIREYLGSLIRKVLLEEDGKQVIVVDQASSRMSLLP